MLPRVQPIIPIRKKEPFDDPAWLFEFKYDGFRGLWYFDRGRGRFTSRSGNRLSRFDALADQVAAALDVEDAILDGEVIVADATGRPQFYDLLRHRRAPAHVAFDLLWLNGADLRPLPLSERRRVLETMLPAGSPIIAGPLAVTGKGSKLFALICGQPLTRWLNIKNPDYSQQEGRGELLNSPRRRPPRLVTRLNPSLSN